MTRKAATRPTTCSASTRSRACWETRTRWSGCRTSCPTTGIADLSNLIVINYLLERDRLAEVTPNLTTEDRYHARTQLDSRRSALASRLSEALRRAYGVSSPDDTDLGPRATDPVMTLARDLEPRLPAGQAIKSAFHHLCFQLLDHRYPTHPDFDPNGRGVPVRSNELEVVLDAVEHAAQDKVGRYEVPTRADIAVLKKIANPLKLGVMHEAAFVLNRDWPDILHRKAAGADQVTVTQLREWIKADQPGLPEIVQNLVIASYAIQADKAWVRAGRPIDAPKLDKITSDMVLRSQELPSEAEFELRLPGRQGIFRIQRQPVRSLRSVHALADAIRRNASGRLPAAEKLTDELAEHASTLGLSDDEPRMATSGRGHGAAGQAGGDHRRHRDGPCPGRCRPAARERLLPGSPGERRDW